MGSFPTIIDCQDFEASPVSASDITAVTIPSTINTMSAITPLVASTAADATGMLLTINLGTAGGDFLTDVMIGPSGSEVVLVPSVLTSSPSVAARRTTMWLPIHVPAGTRVSVRAQSSGSALQYRAGVTMLYGNGLSLQDAATYGANTATSGGTSVDPGGTANTKGAWVQLTAATSMAHRMIMVMIGNQANTGRVTGAYTIDIGAGAAGSERVVVPDLPLAASAGDDLMEPTFIGPFPCSLRLGERLSVRAQSTVVDPTDRTFDVAVMGLA